MADKVYSAREVTCEIAGQTIDSGFADGEFIRIVQESDDFEDVAGSDGEVAVYSTNDRRTTVTLTLMQTSDGNDVLSALRQLAINGPSVSLGAGELMIRDRLGRSIFEAPAVWIRKPPDTAFSRGVEARAWTLRVAQMFRFDGGNNLL